jgi:hypothetical protein
MFYVDDSGAEKAGLALFGWIEVELSAWTETLGHVLAWREHLSTKFGIPKSYELHAVDFVNGRGNPSATDLSWNRFKSQRAVIAEDLCLRMRSWPLKAQALYQETTARRHQYKRICEQLYVELVEKRNAALVQQGHQGLVIVDGDGTDPAYRRAHRKLSLSDRAIIEDPMFQHSDDSQLIQIADFVAYSAYLALHRPQGKESMWGWFDLLGGELIKSRPVDS